MPFGEYIDVHQPLPEGEHVFDVRDFGAVAEKYLLNTEAFAAAAKACEEAGGGIILVAGGSYWTGTVNIPSNTTLFIAADAEIVASRNVDNLVEPAGSPLLSKGLARATWFIFSASGREYNDHRRRTYLRQW